MRDKTNVQLDEELNLSNDFPVPAFDEWEMKVEQDLKGASFEKKLITKTYEGINLNPTYTKKDLESLESLNSYPGCSVYMRGTNASGYLKSGWEISQEIPYGDASEFNEALKNDLSKGQTSININLDTATKLGLDADYANTLQVGDTGLSISGIDSFRRALKDIDIEKYPLHINAGFSSVPMLTILNAYSKSENINLKNVYGSVEADPLGYIALNGTLPVKLDFIFDKMKLAVEWIKQYTPGIGTIGISGMPYNSAGSNAVQDLAFTMATAVEYLTQLLERGLSVNDVASSMRFTFGIGPFFFMEIAKLRAARVMWYNILDEYNASDESKKMFIHGRTSTFNQTVYDPHVNMLRTTTEAFSSIIGGVDSLHTNPFDESYSVGDRFSRRIARNTQIILNEEMHLSNLIDPSGGSYYVESLTNELAEASWKEFQKIEEMGGMLVALKSGYPQKAVDEVNEARIKDIKKRKNVIVGTNMYANVKENKPEIKFTIQDEFYKKRSEYLQKFRVSGNSEKNKAIIEELNQLVEANSIELINIGTQALLDGATLGEISHAVRAATDDSITIEKLKPRRASELFEELRNSSFKYEEETGSKPKIFLANIGSIKQFKARADFSRGFFEVGGFEVIYPNGFEKIESAIDDAVQSKSKAVVICSTDDKYEKIVALFTKGLKEKDTSITVILAGYPKDKVGEYREAGVDDFIFLGCDAYHVLSSLLTKIGVNV